jgi:hypothetical protein
MVDISLFSCVSQGAKVKRICERRRKAVTACWP